jgi:hypothetical protein
MSIPNFKSQEDWQEFLNIFDDQWQCKREMLNRVKNDLFPEYKSWDQLQPHTMEVINDIVSNLVYEVERQFKENVTEALKEALESQKECPPCDTLQCSDHLTDE